ncbi:MAG: diphthine synthase [Candidatus Pacearchaeota archaeon]|nr:diphthine synthase [Candidatus Pacearchaeota archaeon]
MLYLIGVGLEAEDISVKAIEVCKKCEEIYLENYTTSFPYHIKKLEKIIKKKIVLLKREQVESDFLIKRAKDKNIALLVYGDPLIGTTHISLVRDAKNFGIKARVIHNVSIFDAISEIGLFMYKFGKITSLPKWKQSYKPESFFSIIKENLSHNAHTLLLVDPELNFGEAISEIKEADKENLFEEKKIVVVSCAGTKNRKILFDKISELAKKEIIKPFCFVIPAELSYGEEINTSS